MRICRLQFASALAGALLAGCLTGPALAQRGVGQGRGKGQHAHGENARPGGPHSEADKKQRRGGMRGMLGLPPKWMEQLREMSPQEQQRFLSNNERFQQLPPERQAQIRKRLQEWNNLTPQQRADVRRREEVWRQMTPEQRRHIREELLPKWQQVPPDRRQEILKRLRALRDVNESERAAKLNDPAFLQGLSPDEQAMLRELSKLRAGTPPEPVQGNQ